MFWFFSSKISPLPMKFCQIRENANFTTDEVSKALKKVVVLLVNLINWCCGHCYKWSYSGGVSPEGILSHFMGATGGSLFEMFGGGGGHGRRRARRSEDTLHPLKYILWDAHLLRNWNLITYVNIKSDSGRFVLRQIGQGTIRKEHCVWKVQRVKICMFQKRGLFSMIQFLAWVARKDRITSVSVAEVAAWKSLLKRWHRAWYNRCSPYAQIVVAKVLCFIQHTIDSFKNYLCVRFRTNYGRKRQM